MKRKFFKKLSFVMALAMIISMIAPAAGAFAATALKLNAASKVLFLGENDVYNFDVLNSVKGQTHKWTSSNTKVATVGAKTGVVTAKAIGKTTIKVVVSNAKGVVKTLTAAVTVGDNMTTIAIIAPAGADSTKLNAGTDYDFNRTFETMSGSAIATSNITVWSVDKEGAKISTTGVFHATKAGEYTITATAFRGKAQYNAWVASGSSDDSDYIKAFDSVDVTVVNSIKEVKQASTSEFKVVFAGEVGTSLSTTKASVAQVVNGTDIKTGAEKIKSITLDSTGSVATVELYADFEAKATYKFVYEEMEGTFTTASKDAKDITGIVFDDFNVNISNGGSANLLDYISAVNADGVKMLSGSDISSYLTFEPTSDQSKGFVDNASRLAYIYKSGDTVTVKATYTNYLYNETTKKNETVTFSDSAVGTGVIAEVNASTMQYAIVATPATGTSSHPSVIAKDWTDEKGIAVGDGSYDIYTRYKKTTDPSKADYTYTTISSTTFKYESSDPGKLSVYGNTLNPLAAGTVAVIVKNTDGTKVLGSFEVKINAERMLASATPEAPVVTVGNHSLYGEIKEIGIVTLDNLGKNMKAAQMTASTPELLNQPANAAPLNIQTPTIEDGKVKIKLDARNAIAGLYRYKVRISDVTSTGTVTKEVVFEVNVAESNTATGNANVPVNYIIVLERVYDFPLSLMFPASEVVSFDYFMALLPSGININSNVYGVNSSGYRVSKYTHGSDYLAEVKLNGAVVVTGSALTIATNYPSALPGGMSTVKLQQPLGSYNISVTSVSGGAIQRPAGSTFAVAAFSLASGIYAPNCNVKAFALKQSTHATIKAVLKDALELSVSSVLGTYAEVDFDTISAADIDIRGINTVSGMGSINFTDPVNAGTDLYIDTITVRIPGTSSSVVKSEFTFDVKQSIAIK